VAPPSNPTFSPDGQFIAFYSAADRTLKRVGVGGGAAATICPIDSSPLGLSWHDDDLIIAHRNQGIQRVSASGGQLTVLAANKPRIRIGRADPARRRVGAVQHRDRAHR